MSRPAAVLLLAVLTVGCGQKGDLYLPEPAAGDAAADPSEEKHSAQKKTDG